ncbi:MAG: oligopeptidase A [Francisellaceae bacterium]|jgi:oligopeptidase A
MSEQTSYQVSPLPKFSTIKTENIVPTVKHLINECRELRDNLLSKEACYSWNNIIAPLNEQEEKLDQMFSPVRHLSCVANTPELREAYQAAIQLLTEYGTEVGQHKGLYEAYKFVKANDQSLDQPQQKSLDDAIKSFKDSGVALPKDEREKYKKIMAELASLSNAFENNVLDATMGWEYHTDEVSELLGLSDEVKAAAKSKADSKDKSGYLFGLDMPTYMPIMMTAENRKLREKFYIEYATRATDLGANAGKWDNTKNIQEILKHKSQQAQLLGFVNYAELSIDSKMANSIQEVNSFLNDLLTKSKPQAKRELTTLKQFAESEGLEDEFQSWDVMFYSEKLKQKLFNFSEEELRQYFPLNKVLDGFYKTIKAIYGLSVKQASDYDTYHQDVKLLEFYDESQTLRGKIFVDLFARDHKRGGAWMDECRVRYVKLDNTLQFPVAYVNGNFTPPQKGLEATLTHNDVLTMFHEFGHALHHILTKVDYTPVSGINGVEWDAVELPSQFMENFCWENGGLNLISKHIKTGESLPKDILDKLNESRHFQSAMQMVRQIEFSLLDIALHSEFPIDVQQTIDDVRQKTSVMIPPKYNKFQNSFGHVFAGGYAAGYYSYKWAEVLSSDAFAKFREAESILDRETGARFLNEILEKGGSQPAAVLFENFRGRKPSVDALLEDCGIH